MTMMWKPAYRLCIREADDEIIFVDVVNCYFENSRDKMSEVTKNTESFVEWISDWKELDGQHDA